MKLSIIIPTIGRKSLATALDSILTPTGQVQVIVVSDGADAERMVTETEWPGGEAEALYHRLPERHYDWGCAARTKGIELSTGDYLMFLDDDDWYCERALDTVYAVIEEYPNRPLMFRMTQPSKNGVVWEDPVVRRGNVSSQIFVVPNDPERLGKWTPHYAGDLDFITSTLAKWPPDSLLWREEVIVTWGR